jgi:hypothetical protein
VANTNLVASCHENASPETSTATTKRDVPIFTKQPKRKTPTPPENVPDNVSLIREQLENRGFSATATNVMEASWRSGTRRQYECTLSKWKLYCSESEIDTFSPTVEQAINFLGSLYGKGIGYSGINTARSALSSILILPNNVFFWESSFSLSVY